MKAPAWLHSTPLLISLSAAIHLGLLLYADHVDGHPEQYGGLKYTDVDWRVVLDGARLIFRPVGNNRAQGWLSTTLGLPIGDPYRRATFRYTPLLPLLLSPSLLHPLAGKLILAAISLSIPLIVLSSPSPPPPETEATKNAPVNETHPLFWPIHLLWTLNPFVLNITTRGSPEAVIVALVMALLLCLERSAADPPALRRKWEDGAAVLLAMAISYKVYPIIYVPSIWTFLSRRHGWLGAGVWRFGFLVAISLTAINGLMWSMSWGAPFLEHTFFYHLTRLDHRHNFSPYFYPIYLSLFPSPHAAVGGYPIPSWILRVLRHPLTSFLPQNSLVLAAGFSLARTTTLGWTFFVQTVLFVIFNKVITSQYFMWWIPLLASSLPHLRISGRQAGWLLGAWIGGQAVWLGSAYQLEFLAKEVHLLVWAAGIALFGVSTWVLGELIDAYRELPARVRARRKASFAK